MQSSSFSSSSSPSSPPSGTSASWAFRCYAVLCGARQRYAIFTMRLAMRCHAMPCHAMQCDAMRCYAVLCDAMRGYARLCDAMQCWHLPRTLQQRDRGLASPANCSWGRGGHESPERARRGPEKAPIRLKFIIFSLGPHPPRPRRLQVCMSAASAHI